MNTGEPIIPIIAGLLSDINQQFNANDSHITS